MYITSIARHTAKQIEKLDNSSNRCSCPISSELGVSKYRLGLDGTQDNLIRPTQVFPCPRVIGSFAMAGSTQTKCIQALSSKSAIPADFSMYGFQTTTSGKPAFSIVVRLVGVDPSSLIISGTFVTERSTCQIQAAFPRPSAERNCPGT